MTISLKITRLLKMNFGSALLNKEAFHPSMDFFSNVARVTL